MIYPGEPTGSAGAAVWLRKLLRWCKSIELQPGNGYRVKKTPAGMFLDLGASGGASGTPVKQFKVKSHSHDVIVANEFSGTVTSTIDVNIAKPYKLRFYEITAQTIDGTTISYDGYNTTTQARVAHIGTTVAETQVIVPRYLVDDIIYACKPNDTDVNVTVSAAAVPVLWQDVNVDGRAWARKYGT